MYYIIKFHLFLCRLIWGKFAYQIVSDFNVPIGHIFSTAYNNEIIVLTKPLAWGYKYLYIVKPYTK